MTESKKKKQFSFVKIRDKISPLIIMYLISLIYIVAGLVDFFRSFMAGGITDILKWQLITIILMIAAVLVSVLMYRRNKDLHMTVAIHSFGLSVSTAITYCVLMSFGNLLQFSGAFLATVVCVAVASLSLDMFLGRMDAAQSMKPLCLVIAIGVTAFMLCDYTLEYKDISIYNISVVLLFLALLFVYRDRRVMKRMKYRDIYFPRVQFLASVLFIFGLMMIIRPDFNNSEDILDEIAIYVLLGTGLFFLVFRWVDKITSLAIMSMAIASYAILFFFFGLFSSDILKIITASVVLVVASLCIIMSLLLYAGDKYNTVRLKFIVIIIAVLYVTPLLLEFRSKSDMVYILEHNVNHIMFIALVISTYLALTDPAIRYYNTKFRLEYNVKILNYSLCNIPDAYIFRKDLRNLLDDSKWRENDPGSMMKEKSVVIHVGDTRSILSIQKWNDTGKTTGELAHNKGETYVQAHRFTIDKMVLDGSIDDCTMLTMYDDKGFFTRIMVADEIDGSKVGRIHGLLYILIGHDPNTRTVGSDNVLAHKE